MGDTPVAANLERMRAAICNAAIETGRDPSHVKLVAVSKRKPVDAIREAYECGQRDFGENRVQELVEKQPDLPDDIRWHCIGHLQRNKVRPAVETSWLIHSVDSMKLLNRVDRIAGEFGKVQAILLQANISGEESKYGETLSDVAELVDAALQLDHVDLRGFMTMAPFDAESRELVSIFSALRAFRDRMQDAHKVELPELSMGMTGDYREAIASGATYVRIGTAIFGDRQY